MGWNRIQLRRIENGICVKCGAEMAAHPELKCVTCLQGRRAERMREYRKHMLDSLVSIRDKRRAEELFQYLGDQAKPDFVKRAMELERKSKVRFIFFRFLFDKRRWTASEYVDRTTADEALNDLIVDCLSYAETIPDPIAEVRAFQERREAETHGCSVLAIAMSRYEGLAGDDMRSMNHHW